MKIEVNQLVAIFGVLLIFVSNVAQDESKVANRKSQKVNARNPSPTLAKAFGVAVTGVISSVKVSENIVKVEVNEIKGGVVSKIVISVEDVCVYVPFGYRYSGEFSTDHLKHSIGRRVRFYEAGSFYGFPDGFWRGAVPVSGNAQKPNFGFYSSYVFMLPDIPKKETDTAPKGSPPSFFEPPKVPREEHDKQE